MSHIKSDEVRAAEVADILKALSHPLRLMVVAQLCDGEAHVSDLTERLGVPQALVSQQLRILRMASLVGFRREGGFALYRLVEPRLADLLRCLDGCRPSGR